MHARGRLESIRPISMLLFLSRGRASTHLSPTIVHSGVGHEQPAGHLLGLVGAEEQVDEAQREGSGRAGALSNGKTGPGRTGEKK